MSKQFDILVAGELNVDLIFCGLDGFPSMGKEIMSRNMDLVVGSSSAIFACNAASLGMRLAFAGCVGEDGFGDFLLQQLEKKKIDIDAVSRIANKGTGLTAALSYESERAMVTYAGAMDELMEVHITDEMLRKARHLHLSSVYLQNGLRPDTIKLLKRAAQLGLSTSVDPQWDPHEKWDISLQEWVDNCSVFLPNMSELMAHCGVKTREDALAELKNTAGLVVVKDGENGAWLWDGTKLTHEPARLNNKLVDAIGAGDSFDAGFISAYLEGMALTDCLSRAILMGALNTTGRGGTAAFGSLQEMKRTAEELFNYRL